MCIRDRSDQIEELDEVLKPGGSIPENFEKLIERFLNTYSDWYFSPLRIQKWGGTQEGFKSLSTYDTYAIKEYLEKLLDKGKVKKTTSRHGNLIYKII